MKRLLLAAVLLLPLPAQAQTVWTTTDQNGNVTGYYANAAPVPTPPNCCTVMQMSDPRIAAYQAARSAPTQQNAATVAASTRAQKIAQAKALAAEQTPAAQSQALQILLQLQEGQ
jgi:hypothetical protein